MEGLLIQSFLTGIAVGLMIAFWIRLYEHKITMAAQPDEPDGDLEFQWSKSRHDIRQAAKKSSEDTGSDY